MSLCRNRQYTRVKRACDECRRAHAACSHFIPCVRCFSREIDCVTDECIYIHSEKNYIFRQTKPKKLTEIAELKELDKFSVVGL